MTITWEINPNSNKSNQETDGLVASGRKDEKLYFPVKPSSKAFQQRSYRKPHGVRYDSKTGEVYGYVCGWHQEHIGFSGEKIKPPRSDSNYAWFALHPIDTDDGKQVMAGPLTSDSCHPRTFGLSAEDAQKFYDNVGCAVADVSVYEDSYGIQIAGALRPDVTPAQLRSLQGSDVSPDWRRVVDPRRSIKPYEMCGLMACNESGFITPALVASAAGNGIEATDLVPAGETNIQYDLDTGEITAMFGSAWKVDETEMQLSDFESRITNIEDKFSVLAGLISREKQAEFDKILEEFNN